MPSIFLSHSSDDKPFVRKLAKSLRMKGVKVWLDEAEIRVGDSLIDKISSAINEADFIAAVISANSVNSTWVQKELSLAMSKEIANRQVAVLPILLEKCELPPFLTDKLYANFTNASQYSQAVKKLIQAITPNSNYEIKANSINPTTLRVITQANRSSLNCFVTGFGFGRGISFLAVPDAQNAAILVGFATALGLPKVHADLLDKVMRDTDGDLIQRIISLQEISLEMKGILDEYCFDWFEFGKIIPELVYADHLQPILQHKNELIRKMEFLVNKMGMNKCKSLNTEIQKYLKAVKDNEPIDVLSDYLDRIPPMIGEYLGFVGDLQEP